MAVPNLRGAGGAVDVNALSTFLARPGVPMSAHYRPLKSPTTAVAPTLVQGIDIAGLQPVLWGASAGKFRYVGMNPTALASDANFAVNDNTSLARANFAFQSVEIEFWSNATTVATISSTVNGREDVWALVDDRPVLDGTFQHLPAVDDMVTYKLTQQAPVWRKFRLSLGNTFSGVAINSGAKMVPTQPGFALAVVGDSWVQGGIPIPGAVEEGVIGAINAGAMCGELAQYTGFDVWRCGVSGTGYLNQGTHGAAGRFGSTQRMAKLATLPAMDAVVVFGTCNDQGSTPSAVVAAARAAWTAAKAAQPSAKLIVVGLQPILADAGLDAINAALVAAARSHVDVDAVIDIRTDPIVTGTGNAGAPAGNGNADAFASSDGLHLTHHGNRHVAQRLAALLGTVIVDA